MPVCNSYHGTETEAVYAFRKFCLPASWSNRYSVLIVFVSTSLATSSRTATSMNRSKLSTNSLQHVSKEPTKVVASQFLPRSILSRNSVNILQHISKPLWKGCRTQTRLRCAYVFRVVTMNCDGSPVARNSTKETSLSQDSNLARIYRDA